MTVAAGTQPTQLSPAITTTTPPDTRRITEDHPAMQRVRERTQMRLQRSVRQFVADLRAAPSGEQSAVLSRFIQRHVGILRNAYTEAHMLGQRHYYGQVSARRRLPRQWFAPPQQAQMNKRLSFYAPSVAKMAHEAQMAWHASQIRRVLAEAKAARPAVAAEHTGVMIAFMLAPDAAEALAVPHGEPAQELHVTLAFLGDKGDLAATTIARLRQFLADYAREAQPLRGVVSGIGRFNPSPSSEGKAPIYASVNVPGLQEWRAALVDGMRQATGIGAAADFAYTPHITLLYVDEQAPTPLRSAPDVQLTFETLTLAVGGTHYNFPIGGMGEKKRAFGETVRLDDAVSSDPLDDWADSLGARIQLQADVTWPGEQDGYTQGGVNDPANPYDELWWDLEPAAQHCADCPDVANGSPYGAPGSGNNELTQTPGDGATECGAACKCSLRYGYFGGPAFYDWSDFFPPDMPQMQGVGDEGLRPASPPMTQDQQAHDYWQRFNPEAPPDEAAPTAAAGLPATQGQQTADYWSRFNPAAPPDQASGDGLTDAQSAALDTFRAQWQQWNYYRAMFPQAPDLFNLHLKPDQLPPWDSLTPEQQEILGGMYDAIEAWNDASLESDGGDMGDEG